eukprot:g10222.t1
MRKGSLTFQPPRSLEKICVGPNYITGRGIVVAACIYLSTKDPLPFGNVFIPPDVFCQYDLGEGQLERVVEGMQYDYKGGKLDMFNPKPWNDDLGDIKVEPRKRSRKQTSFLTPERQYKLIRKSGTKCNYQVHD